MPLSPPTKSTMIIGLISVIIGLILGIIGYIGPFDPMLIDVGMNFNKFVYILGFLVPAIGWLLIFIGTRTKGM